MVEYHRQPHPETIVVKPARSRSRLVVRSQRCIWPGCNCALARDHDGLVCSCHVPADFNLRHYAEGAALILHLLIAAYPEAVDLCAVLKTSDHDAVKDRVRFLRRHGHKIIGRSAGYQYLLAVDIAPERRRGAVTVKPGPNAQGRH